MSGADRYCDRAHLNRHCSGGDKISKGNPKKFRADRSAGRGPVFVVRKTLDISQPEMARRLGCSVGGVSKWEADGSIPKANSAALEKLIQIAGGIRTRSGRELAYVLGLKQLQKAAESSLDELPPAERLYTTGEVAAAAQCDDETVRRLHYAGIVVPQQRPTGNPDKRTRGKGIKPGRRYYTAAQLERVKQIIRERKYRGLDYQSNKAKKRRALPRPFQHVPHIEHVCACGCGTHFFRTPARSHGIKQVFYNNEHRLNYMKLQKAKRLLSGKIGSGMTVERMMLEMPHRVEAMLKEAEAERERGYKANRDRRKASMVEQAQARVDQLCAQLQEAERRLAELRVTPVEKFVRGHVKDTSE